MPFFKTPTRAQVEKAAQRMRSPEFAAYFLSRLENRRWITPLHEKGLFASPPPPIRVQGGGLRYPHWPASKYLARMSTHAPAEVAAIFAGIETDNASIIGDLLHAAVAMPTDEAASLVPAVCRAANEGTLWLHFKDASDLCVRLVGGGELDAAMVLAEALFTPTFEKNQEEPSRRDDYWYKEGLKKVVPVLAGARARVFLPKLCDWLKASVQAKKHVHPDSGSDGSYMWRPAIEEHQQNHDYDFAGAMVGFVRTGFEQALRDGRLSLEEALQLIEPYRYLVFRRIRLHLINEFAEMNAKLCRQIILDRDLFEDFQYKHEYALLVGRRLDLLSSDQKEEWLGWIDEGPGKDTVDPEATEEVRKAQSMWWRFEKLHWARNHLEGERRDFYEKMLAKHGEPELADLNVYVGGGRWGHESPMTVESLAAMSFHQVLRAVASWRPEESRFMGPSIEGLASTFEQYVATDPEQFSAKARLLVDQPAIFVRGFIHQMSEAANAGREIDLPAVFHLCCWVVGRPVEERTTPEQQDEDLVDKSWQWTRDEISQFVENVCKAKSDQKPRYAIDGLRQPMWGLIERLCHDRAASYIDRDISKDDPRIRDYLDLGINSPRGEAVKAALEYARWVANHIKQLEGKQEIVPGGFAAMPEVREVLQWQITPDNRSFEVMSVVGSSIGLIYWIDKKWLAENAEQLFQLENIERAPSIVQGWAAWNAFLVWVRPHIEFYRLFRSQFAYAVEQAAKVEMPEETREQPMHHLGEHLMVLYGRGQLGLDEDDGLLRRFIESAKPDVRQHAIGFVGRSLEGDDKVPEHVLRRFETLWDLYWTGPGKKDAEKKPDPWLFGTWFSNGQFKEQWALDRLEQFLDVVPTPQPDAVAEKLAKIAHVDIAKSVRILDRMVRGDREGWRIDGWLDSAKKILEQAMRAGGRARTQAQELINHLGRRGWTDLGELLR